MCLAAISNGQLWIMALVMVTNLVWHDPSNDTVGWAGGQWYQMCNEAKLRGLGGIHSTDINCAMADNGIIFGIV